MNICCVRIHRASEMGVRLYDTANALINRLFLSRILATFVVQLLFLD